ncbi:MAG: DUF4031 domain-containing protein [Azospirillum sp.]|nr:DUF4031 domain-containing protein [Azospirillum sp.]
MTVYVDDMKAKFGRMTMCHMIADSDDELHAMADAVGVSRRYHQAPPEHASHYDIAQSKKAMAIARGAIPITWRQCGLMIRRRAKTGELGPPEDARAWFDAGLEARATARDSSE